MSSFLRLLIGPELLWGIFYLIIFAMVKWSGAPQKRLDEVWVNLAYVAPFIAVPLSFATYYLPGVERNWLLLRIWIACLFGAHYVLDKGLSAHSEQGPGVGAAYLMGMIFVIVVLIGGSIWLWIKRQ